MIKRSITTSHSASTTMSVCLLSYLFDRGYSVYLYVYQMCIHIVPITTRQIATFAKGTRLLYAYDVFSVSHLTCALKLRLRFCSRWPKRCH